MATSHSHSWLRLRCDLVEARAGPWRQRRVVQRPCGGARRGPRRRGRGRWLAEAAECRAGEGGEREHGRLAPQDLGSRDRRHGHRLDLDVGARLIGVDLQEHVADAQGRALAMGDDDLDLFHAGHYRLRPRRSRAVPEQAAGAAQERVVRRRQTLVQPRALDQARDAHRRDRRASCRAQLQAEVVERLPGSRPRAARPTARALPCSARRRARSRARKAPRSARAPRGRVVDGGCAPRCGPRADSPANSASTHASASRRSAGAGNAICSIQSPASSARAMVSAWNAAWLPNRFVITPRVLPSRAATAPRRAARTGRPRSRARRAPRSRAGSARAPRAAPSRRSGRARRPWGASSGAWSRRRHRTAKPS